MTDLPYDDYDEWDDFDSDETEYEYYTYDGWPLELEYEPINFVYEPPSRLMLVRWAIQRRIADLRALWRDPWHFLRRCAVCGKRGCTVGSRFCRYDDFPF